VVLKSSNFAASKASAAQGQANNKEDNNNGEVRYKVFINKDIPLSKPSYKANNTQKANRAIISS
jgi:hypothetical protein